MKIGLGAAVKLFQMYLKGGPTPPLDPLHMHISPWCQFSTLGVSAQFVPGWHPNLSLFPLSTQFVWLPPHDSGWCGPVSPTVVMGIWRTYVPMGIWRTYVRT